MPVISVSAVVIQDSAGSVLTVRKRGTASFMFPGGKPEPGESALAAAAREVREELGLEVCLDDLHHLGRWETAAANEAGWDLVSEVFELRGTDGAVPDAGRILPRAEIEELRWINPLEGIGRPEVAPLTRECVFPYLIDRAAARR
ncbi:NUDIX domain-containing protein [Rothia sp. AR01]|uniref:NUDIX domain-containing protein n=1 Tax=Rothia santali TaxID=2949643 RepID=A0A9X2KLF5_9MICC|nr:NUDIX domain-containing protein [Rothia santali]MCP3426101.1 NUDIX domain-containing protein [Rothia santali]